MKEKEEDPTWLLKELREENIDCLDDHETNVIFYIAGCLGRSVARLRKCDACKSCLTEIGDISPFELQEIVEEDRRCRLLNLANRGGLAKPSEYSMIVCSFGYIYFKQIFDNPDLVSKMLQHTSHASTFSSAVLQMLQSDSSFSWLTNFVCGSGHDPLHTLLTKLFNCLSKNVVIHLNANQKITADAKKLRKLQSLPSNK